MTRTRVVIFVIIALAVIGGAYALTHRKKGPEAQNAAPPKPALVVTAAKPTTQDWPIAIAANGAVQAWQEATIAAQIGGLQITEVLADVGDAVKAGDILARFDDNMVKAELAQQKAAVERAEASARRAEADAKRADMLKGSGSMSAQDLASYVTAAQTARADLKVEQAKLVTQSLNLDYTRVTAPDDGVIASRTATIGQVASNGAELFRMIRQGRVEWRAELPEKDVGRIMPGMKVRVTTTDSIAVDGTVRVVSPTINNETRNALVYVDLPSEAGLRPGVFAQGIFLIGNATAQAVPEESVIVRDGYSYVFRIGADKHVTRVKVEAGRRQDGLVEILSGLDADDAVAVKGAGFLNDGDLVTVAADAPPAAPAAERAQ